MNTFTKSNEEDKRKWQTIIAVLISFHKISQSQQTSC